MSINSITQSLLSQPWTQGATNVGTNSILSAGLGVQLPSSMASQDSGLQSALALLGQSGSPSLAFNGATGATSSNTSLSSLTNFAPLLNMSSTTNSFSNVLPTTTQSFGNSTTAGAETLQSLVSAVGSILQSLGAAPAATVPVTQQSGVAQALGMGNIASSSPAVAGTPATQNAQLDKSLAAIASDPDGAKLIARAKQLGVSIKVGDPAQAAGAQDVTVVQCPFCQAAAQMKAAGDVKGAAAMQAKDTKDGGAGMALDASALSKNSANAPQEDGGVIINGVTLSDNNTGQISVVVRDPSNIKTIAHELVHAVSINDGNSKQEEGIADVIGSRVANNLGGAAVGGLSGTEEQIYQNKQQFYPTLQASNNIRQTLATLGLQVSV